MDKFYIDRQFGQAIWIDVENGIVQNCYNEEPKFNAKLNENYKGKSITFLKEDFIDRAMKGTYHHLRAESITSQLLLIGAYKSRIRDINVKIQMNLKTTPPKRENTKSWESLNGELKRLEEQREEIVIKQSQAEQGLVKETDRILTEHNFQS